MLSAMAPFYHIPEQNQKLTIMMGSDTEDNTMVKAEAIKKVIYISLGRVRALILNGTVPG